MGAGTQPATLNFEAMQDEHFMHRAIELAQRGSGNVAPNPMVGAVLVHKNRIIGEGWHERYGDVHAELACIKSVAPEDVELIPFSTIYVTLEPCAHQGKQPPCAHRLVQERIQRVVIAVEDPFPEVSGRGIAILKDSGAKVDVGCCRAAARWMCRRFLSMYETGRPYIILKWAQSANGFFAPGSGNRLQLSNNFSQQLVHKWRTEESAIMVGFNTALADNPQLTARTWAGNQPLRVVLDRTLRLPQSHHLLDGTTSTWIINESMESAGITSYVKLEFNDHLLPGLLARLAAAGRTSVFVEGGARLLNSLVTAGLWDEARVFTTPKTLPEGIRAPELVDAQLARQLTVGSDSLQLYQRADSGFSYPAGSIF